MSEYASVQGLIIEVESDASAASAELDALTGKLEKFKSVISSSRSLSTFAKNFKVLNDAVANVSAVNVANMTNLVTTLKSLDSLKDVKLSSNIANQISRLNEVTANADSANLAAYFNALSGITALNGFEFPKGLVSGLTKVSTFAKTIEGQDFSKLRELTNIIRSLYSVSGQTSTNITNLTHSFNNMTTAMSRSTRQGRSFNTVLANVRTRTLAAFHMLMRVVNFAQNGLTEYGDYIETLNLFAVSMENAGKSAYEFAEKAQSLLGIDLTQWMKAQGVFMSLGKGFGVATDRAALMSQQLTQLAYDISSFYNISVEDAIQKVQSGFSGQLRPMRQLGYDLSVAKLEAIALSLGIDKTVASMTQAEKSQLRYIAMLTQVKDVQGDLSRTLNSPVNQLRILQAQVQQMYRSLGLLLLPVLNNLLPYLNAIVRVLKMIMDEVASLFGYTLPTIEDMKYTGGLSVETEELTEDLEEANGAAEKLKNTLASFDQINLITSKSGGSGKGSGVDGLGSEWNFDLPTYDFLGDATENKAKQIAKDMMNAIRPVFEFVKDVISFIKANFQDIVQIVTTLATVSIGIKLLNALGGALKLSDDMKLVFDDLVKGLALITIGFQFSYLGGQNLAQGNWGLGLLQSIGGIIAAAFGGYLIGNVPGLAIGVGLSLIFAVSGYMDEKSKAYVESLNEIFFSIDEGKQDIQDFVDEWGEFTAALFDPDVIEKGTTYNALKNEINGVGNSIMLLRANYAQGIVDANVYVNSMDEEFKRLSNLVEQYLGAAGNVISEGLNGALGVFLLSLGFTADEVESMISASTNNASESMNEIVSKVNELGEQFKSGDLGIDEYNEQIGLLITQLNGFIDIEGLSSNAVSEFEESVKGINFDSFEQALDAITQINTHFDTALKGLHTERDSMLAAMTDIGKALPDDYKQRWEEVISATSKYYDEQEQKLVDGYYNTLGTLETEGYLRWDKIFRTEEFKGAYKAFGTGMTNLDEAIGKSLRDRKLERQASALHDSVRNINLYNNALTFGSGDAMREFMEQYDVITGNQIRISDRFKKTAKDFDTVTGNYKSTFKSWEDVVLAWMDENASSASDMYRDLKSTTENSSKAFGNMSGNISNSLKIIPVTTQTQLSTAKQHLLNNITPMYNNANTFVSQLGKSMDDKKQITSNKMQAIITASKNLLTSNKQEFYNKSGEMVLRVKGAFEDKTQTVKNAFNTLLNKVKDVDLNSFKSKGNSMRDNLIDGYTDTSDIEDKLSPFKDTISSLFNPEDFYDVGEEIGNELDSGISSTESSIEQTTKDLTKKMGKPFGQFGDDLWTFMTTMGSGIRDLWNSLEISAGSAKWSTKNVKKWKFSGYATGGFPESGELFFANENGTAEYIGSMGNKTAVANNAEIIKGVSDGVYRALKDSGLVGDVKAIANKSGKVVFAPSEDAGRVMAQSVAMYNQTGGRY